MRSGRRGVNTHGGSKVLPPDAGLARSIVNSCSKTLADSNE